MDKYIRFILVFAFSFVGFGVFLPDARSQEEGGDIESLFKDDEKVPSDFSEDLSDIKNLEINEVSDLGKLVPFADVAVIQKRFLPKTGRFEFFLAGSSILNDVFFLGLGLNGRIAYYFQERFGLELVGSYLKTSERQVTIDLRDKRGVTAENFITPTSYIGLDLKWVPIYGKMTWVNKRIVPFDLYFSAGGGNTATNQGTSELTMHLGSGQTFALSKSTAFRWDFSWNVFSAKSTVAGGDNSSVYNNLILSVGMSFFFPEATYR